MGTNKLNAKQQQRINQLKAVFNSVIEAVEDGYYTKRDGLALGDINYMEIREWAEMEMEGDNLTPKQILEDRMIEDVCHLVQHQLYY